LKIDGIFGPKTRAAAVAFQKKAELKPDGIVGRKTWFSLVLMEHKEPSATPKPVSAPSPTSDTGIATSGPAPTPEAAPTTPAPPKKRGVDEWSMAERFEYVVTHTLGHLKPEFRSQFAALLTPTNIGIMVGSLVIWAAGHFFGVSEIADAFLLGFGLFFLGKAAIDAARLLKNVIELTCSASTEPELEDAAKDLAAAIGIIGVMAFFFLLGKVARAIGNKLKAAKAAEKGGSAPGQKEAPPDSKPAPEQKTETKTESSKDAAGSQEKPLTGRPPKSSSDLDTGRQNIHKPGTNEYKTRSISPKGKPTAWKNPSKGDALTLEAYEKGTVTETYPDGSPKEIKWDAGEAVGENGESQVSVKLKANGKMHGFPSGPKDGG
jgi:hypothetical protein